MCVDVNITGLQGGRTSRKARETVQLRDDVLITGAYYQGLEVAAPQRAGLCCLLPKRPQEGAYAASLAGGFENTKTP